TASVTITSPADGAVVAGPDVAVSWSGVAAGPGDHVHLALDGGAVVEVGLSGAHVFGGVGAGPHTVTAAVAGASAGVYANAEASDDVDFTVTGGSAVTPTAPIPLFDGQSLSGLYPWFSDSGSSDPDEVFSVEDGLLRVSGEHWGALTTATAYRDYVMVLEFKWGQQTWPPRQGKAKDAGV